MDDVRAYELRNGIDAVVLKYEHQREGAKKRGIEWLFDLKGWLDVWEGKISKRGRGLRALCMCRHKDQGPYAPWNVRIATGYENKLDWWEKKPKWFRKEGKIKIDGCRGTQGGIEDDPSAVAALEIRTGFGR